MLESVFIGVFSGAATILFVSKVRDFCKPQPKKWEPFEPGICATLPEHEWGWECDNNRFGAWRCPKCRGSATPGKSSDERANEQPPYCDERGGHFHFKCYCCGYEWAMKTADRVAPKKEDK